MSWFRRGKRQPGWLALGLHQDRVDLVHVKRAVSGTPIVALCDSFRNEGSESETLARLRKELRLQDYRCTTLLGAEDYQLLQVEAPAVPAAEMKAAVGWRVKDIIDYPLESATIDVLEIPGSQGAAAASPTLYVVAANNDAIRDCLKPFDTSEIELEAIDVLELAQRNIAALYEPQAQGVAMLAFYGGDGILTFTCGGEMYVSRRIEISLAELIDERSGEREQYLDRIALVVQRSLDHFEREYNYVPLAKLLVAPLPRDIGLTDYLATHIDGVVEPIDLSEVMDFAAVPELRQRETQARYLPMLGAALRGEEAAAA
jgi:MSHA biogenesis protein MshI